MVNIVYIVGGIGVGHAQRSEKVIRELIGRGHKVSISADARAYAYFNNGDLKKYLKPELPYFTFAGGDYDPDIKKSVISCFKLFDKNSLLRRFFAQHMEVRKNMRSIKGGPDVVVADGNITALRVASYNFFNVKQVYVANFTRVPLSILPLVEMAINVYLKYILLRRCKIVIPDIPKPLAICDHLVNRWPNIEFVGPIHKMSQTSKRGKDILIPMTNHKLARALINILKNCGHNCLITFGNKTGKVNEEDGNVSLVSWVDEFNYDDYSLVVTKPGHRAIWDNIANLKPMVLITSKGHGEERANALKARKLGLGEIVYTNRLRKLPKTIEKVLKNYDFYLANISKLNKEASKYASISKIADIIEESAEKSNNLLKILNQFNGIK
jgi:uncharacterized protein (TIGR00661 family)